MGDSNHNDVTCASKTVTITERPVTFTATDQSKVYDGTPLEATETNPYNCTLTAGSVVSGHTYTCVSSGSITNVGIETKVLESATIKSNDDDKSSNYDITKIDGSLEVTSAVVGCPSISNYSGTYDGAAHTITVGTPSFGTMEYKESTATEWSTTKPTRTDVGTTTVNIRVKGDENHDDVTCSNGTIKVNSRKITVKATNQEKVYDGEPLDADETGDNKCTITSGSVAAGHTFNCVSTGSQTNAGSSTKTLSTVTINDSLDSDVTSNYNITKSNGTLTVTKADAECPTIVDYNDVYDGNAHTISVTGGSGGTIQHKTSSESDTAWSTTMRTRTNVGTVTINTRVLGDSNHNTVTCVNKAVTITPRFVTFTAANQIKPYDGDPLVADETGDNKCKITSGDVVSGHTFTCNSTGSQTNVGSSTKTLSTAVIKSGSTDVSSNYDITLINGTLTVTKVPAVCPTITDYNGVYDGNSHTITVGTVSTGTIQYKRSTATSWSTTKPTRTNAGSTIVNIRIVGDENHDNETCTNGIIEIAPKEVTITATNQEKIYDGTELDATESIVDGIDYKCYISNGSMATGDSFSCTSSGSITNVGTEPKVIDDVSIYKGSTDVSTNYTISKVNGTLKVNKKSIIVSTTDQSKTYDANTMNATNDCTSSSLAYGDSISCTNSGEIKYVGTTEKQIGAIVVRNSNNEDVTENYDFTREDGNLTVSPKSITVSTTNQSKIYDRTPLVATNDCTAVGLQGEDYIQCNNTGTITNVGTEPKIIDTILIRDQSGVDVTNNYTDTRVSKTLTVTKKELGCPTIESYDDVYDGNSHTITVGSVESGTIEYKDSTSDTWSETLPTRTDAGTTTINIRVKGDENHDDVTCSDGTVKISSRELTVKAKNQSKVYDGEFLEATEESPYTCEVTSGDIVSGQNVVCTSAGRIKEVGTETKELEDVIIMNNDQDVSNNYNITKENGVLEVTSAESVCPTVTPYSGIYDGNSHTITVGSITTGEITYKSNDSNEWTTVLPRRTNYGETTINIKVTGDNNHNDVVCPNGKIKINKRPITVTTTNETKEYDGEPLIPTNNTCSIKTGSSLANNERLTGCTTSGTQTNVGESDKTITSIIIKGTNDQDIDLNNYDITYEKGKLIITGEFEPTIVKNVISTKRYYRFNDTVRYKITITNTANYSIKNIKVRENNINARFVEGTGYTLLSNQLVNVISINPLSSINIYAEYKVGKTETNKVDNEVEIISAESDIGATLKDEEYKDTATFGIQSKIRICKNISGVSIPNKFQFKVTGIENGFGSDVSLNKDECINVYVDPGKYKVTEIIPEEYEIVSVTGAISSNGGIINVVQGQDYEVTFTNKYTQKVYFHGYGRRENKVEGGE